MMCMECNKTPLDELVVNKLMDYDLDLLDLHHDMEFLKKFLSEYLDVEQTDIILNGNVTVIVEMINDDLLKKLSNIGEKTNQIAIEIKPRTKVPDRIGIEFTFKH